MSLYANLRACLKVRIKERQHPGLAVSDAGLQTDAR